MTGGQAAHKRPTIAFPHLIFINIIIIDINVTIIIVIIITIIIRITITITIIPIIIIISELGMANAVDNYQYREMSGPLFRDKLQERENLELLET